MPYSYTSPDDLPLPPPRNATIPALWNEIKQGRRTTRTPAEKPQAEAAAAQHLSLLVAHISHCLTPIPGAVDALRAAIQTIWPILFPVLAAAPPGGPE